jgi:serine/threonine protein kinase
VIGTTLADRYEVVAELGRGGMGVVYRARDQLLERDVAVKVLSRTTLSAESEERFLREARTVAQMDHPGIVPVHDVGRESGLLFFVMPVVAGADLRTSLRSGPLSQKEVADVGIQVA